MSRRLPALALAAWLVCFAAGCGKYGAAKRFPPAGDVPVPDPVEQSADDEATETDR